MTTAVNITNRDDGYFTAIWASLAMDETGIVAKVGHIAGMKTVQLTGTFGGATIAIQGSLDNVTFFPLHVANFDTGDYEVLTGLSAARFDAIIENPLYVKTVVTGGGGATDLKVIIGANSRL